jgi:hypothetical protein
MAYTTYTTGTFLSAVTWGVVSSLLGGFGHNWVHQPWFKAHGYALSLDVIGFSSEVRLCLKFF